MGALIIPSIRKNVNVDLQPCMPQENKQFRLPKKHVFVFRKQTPEQKQREM